MLEPRPLQEYTSSRAWNDQDETPLLRDVSFNRHSMNDGEHVSPYDTARVPVGDDEIVVKLVQGLNPEFKDVLSRATRATIGIDLKGGGTDNRDWEEMLRGGLQTALETQVVVFEVSGVSRACTHQLVRTRKAAFHQQSMRASFYGNQPEFRIPESVWRAPDNVREAWRLAIEAQHKAYQLACEADVSYQDSRYILGEGTTNYIMLEYPLREFINVFAYRGCSMFQWEIVSVMRACRYVLVGAYPFLEPYIKISCEKTKGALDAGEPAPGRKDDMSKVVPYHPDEIAHHCTFQGWEEVEGQCPFPWARESNRSFQPEHHKIKKVSGG
jgi:thymidylate synthase (FAD)